MTTSSERGKLPKVVVGLDLSLTGTGVCVLGEGSITVDTIRSKPAASLTGRAARIRDLARHVCNAAVSCDLVVVEGPAYSRNTGSMWDRAGLWWKVMGDLVAFKQDVAVCPPNVAKKFATGKGTADKTAVAAQMARVWPTCTAANDNEWDAVALAYMGAVWLGMDVPVLTRHRQALAGVEWPPVRGVIEEAQQA